MVLHQRLHFTLVSSHVMRKFIFTFEWLERKTTPYLLLLFLFFGGSIFFRFSDINVLILLLTILSTAIHRHVPAFFFYMPKLFTNITSYMFHIPSIAINSFVTKHVARKQYPLKYLEADDLSVRWLLAWTILLLQLVSKCPKLCHREHLTLLIRGKLLALWHRFGAMAQVLSLMATFFGNRSQFRHSESRKRHIRRFI